MEQIKITLPSIDEVQYLIQAEEEHIPVRGDALVSGDDKEDKRVEDSIINRRRTNVWAWASVCVTAEWKGIQSEPEYLGACSYRNEADFVKNSGYYDDMKQTCYDNLIERIKELADEG